MGMPGAASAGARGAATVQCAKMQQIGTCWQLVEQYERCTVLCCVGLLSCRSATRTQQAASNSWKSRPQAACTRPHIMPMICSACTLRHAAQHQQPNSPHLQPHGLHSSTHSMHKHTCTPLSRAWHAASQCHGCTSSATVRCTISRTACLVCTARRALTTRAARRHPPAGEGTGTGLCQRSVHHWQVHDQEEGRREGPDLRQVRLGVVSMVELQHASIAEWQQGSRSSCEAAALAVAASPVCVPASTAKELRGNSKACPALRLHLQVHAVHAPAPAASP